MGPDEIANRRLANQRIAAPTCQSPLDVVTWLGALQAQDYRGVLWSIGLRMPDATIGAVERAIADRLIVRTWPLRRTLHFVAAADVRWLLALLRPRTVGQGAGRLRQLEIDERTISRSAKALTAALRGGQSLARSQMYEVLERSRVSPVGQRGIHIIWRLAVDGVLCFAAHAGKQPTFALLDEWAPLAPATLDRDAALAELARRYFQSHGPATVHDFAWWSGLTVSDAKAGASMLPADFAREAIDGRTYIMATADVLPPTPPSLHLLPGFDEFLLGYKDRSAVLTLAHARKVVPGSNGVFRPTIVAGGRVVGLWKPYTPFRRLTQRESQAYRTALKRYDRFVESTS
jgi:Winged helix DNA-binding domain